MIGQYKWAGGTEAISRDAALLLANKVVPPSWATHIAVRYDGLKIEPAQWNEACKEFMDQDVRNAHDNDWAGAYKSYYWSFIPVTSRTK